MIRIEEEGKTRRATVEDTNKWHKEQAGWLVEEIEKAKEKKEKVVVMTHHAPTFERTSHPQYKGLFHFIYYFYFFFSFSLLSTGNAIQPGFATNLEHLLASPVTAWFFGHTHYNDPYFFANNNNNKNDCVLVSSNQVGYFAKGDRNSTFSTKYCVTVGREGKVVEDRE